MAGYELNRRDALRGGALAAGVGALSIVGGQDAAAAPRRATNECPENTPRPKMVVGTQRGATTTAILQEFRRNGVVRVCGAPADPPFDQGTGTRGYWLKSEVEKTKEFIEGQGLQMEMAVLPFLGSTLIDNESRPAIMLGRKQDRDRDIEDVQRMIEACAGAGVYTIKYNMSLLGVLKTGSVTSRGATFRKFSAKDLDYSLPKTIAGTVDADTFWERIDYFLERVVPVANQYKVRLACHPQDPGTPPGGYRGVQDNVLSVSGGKGLFKFLKLHSSRYHGLNLCVGTLAEMLWNPEKELYPVFRSLVKTGRVFNIHLRNIKGGRNNFQECWPDEGVYDQAEIINIAADEGYDGSVDPDHVGQSSADPGSSQAFAYGYGYINGLISGAQHRAASKRR